MIQRIYIALIVLLLVSYGFRKPVQAQMMGKSVNSTNQEQTAKDEAEGKVVWDKLQNKQVTCKDLKDDDFDVLGDFFMGNMMGGSHDSMNQRMAQQLGDDGEKLMHIAMGKRLSGCDTNSIMSMMGYGGMMGQSFGIFGSLTWIAVLVFLILGSIYFWKEIQRKK